MECFAKIVKGLKPLRCFCFSQASEYASNGYIYFSQKDLVNSVKSWDCELRSKGQRKAKIKLGENNE